MTDTSTSPKPPTFAGIEAAIEDPAEITRSTDKAPHTSDQVPSIASLSSSPLSTSNESSNNKKKAAEDQPPSMSTSTSNSAGPLTHTLANTTIPPTLREILLAYGMHDDANKDRGMLLDVLRAKSAEDQRIAALANVQLIQLQASLLQFHTALSNSTNTPASGSNGSGNSPALGSNASPLEVLAMLSADASARGSNSNITRSSLADPRSIPSTSQSQPQPQSRPRPRASPSAKRLSPPISHMSSDISGENSPVRRKKSHISSPPPPYSQPRKSSTDRPQPPSPKGTEGKPGSVASPPALAAPILSRKPLAHLLAPLPTSSVLYPSRRNPQPGAATPSTPTTPSSGSSPGVNKMDLAGEGKGIPDNGAVVVSAIHHGGVTPAHRPQSSSSIDSDPSTSRALSFDDEQSRSRRKAEGERSDADMDMDPPPAPLVKEMGAFVIIDGARGSE